MTEKEIIQALVEAWQWAVDHDWEDLEAAVDTIDSLAKEAVKLGYEAKYKRDS